MEAHAHPGDTVDPRVRRTRLMLFEALQALLAEKDFEKISVLDIAEKATLNRATFYDHYPDKVALLESLIHERFARLIVKHGLRFDVCDGAIKRLVLIVCEFTTEMGCDSPTPRRQLEMHVQMAVIATIRQLIVEGSEAYRLARGSALGDQMLALMATSAAWAICGACKEWARTPERHSAEALAEDVESMIAPMFSALVAPVAQDA